MSETKAATVTLPDLDRKLWDWYKQTKDFELVVKKEEKPQRFILGKTHEMVSETSRDGGKISVTLKEIPKEDEDGGTS